MTNEEMKSILVQGLEYWNQALIRERGIGSTCNTFVAQIIGRMEGMINFAHSAGIINQAERAELNYIYFGEPDLQNLTD